MLGLRNGFLPLTEFIQHCGEIATCACIGRFVFCGLSCFEKGPIRLKLRNRSPRCVNMLLCRRTDPDRAEAVDAKKHEHASEEQLRSARPPGQHLPSDYRESTKRDNRGQPVESFHLRVGRDL